MLSFDKPLGDEQSYSIEFNSPQVESNSVVSFKTAPLPPAKTQYLFAEDINTGTLSGSSRWITSDTIAGVSDIVRTAEIVPCDDEELSVKKAYHFGYQKGETGNVTAGEIGMLTTLPTNVQTGFELEYKVKLKSGNLAMNALPASGNAIITPVGYYNGGNFVSRTDFVASSSSVIATGAFTSDEWNDVKLVVDLVSKTHSILVKKPGEENYQAVIAGAPFRSDSSSLNKLMIRNAWQNVDGLREFGEMYVADVNGYVLRSPAVSEIYLEDANGKVDSLNDIPGLKKIKVAFAQNLAISNDNGASSTTISVLRNEDFFLLEKYSDKDNEWQKVDIQFVGGSFAEISPMSGFTAGRYRFTVMRGARSEYMMGTAMDEYFGEFTVVDPIRLKEGTEIGFYNEANEKIDKFVSGGVKAVFDIVREVEANLICSFAAYDDNNRLLDIKFGTYEAAIGELHIDTGYLTNTENASSFKLVLWYDNLSPIFNITPLEVAEE